LNLEQIRSIPIRVVAAGGPEKVDALYAAVTSRLISVLVTDYRAAQALVTRGRAESKKTRGRTAGGSREVAALR
jgi:DNA-binding transcriptional regulator LsrR (DeoR family)